MAAHQRRGLAHRADGAGNHKVHRQLHHTGLLRALAVAPGFAAHHVEQRLHRVNGSGFSGGENVKLPGLGHVDPSQHRRRHVADAAPGKICRQPGGEFSGDGGHIDHDSAGAQRLVDRLQRTAGGRIVGQDQNNHIRIPHRLAG